jgi:hypothetical protein
MHQMRISTTQVSSVILSQVENVGNPEKKVKNVKEPSDENQNSAMRYVLFPYTHYCSGSPSHGQASLRPC